jgi:hypothetical protein
VFDAVTRLAWQLKDLPMELLGRLRSDRVIKRHRCAPPRARPALGLRLEGPASEVSLSGSRVAPKERACCRRKPPPVEHR